MVHSGLANPTILSLRFMLETRLPRDLPLSFTLSGVVVTPATNSG